MSWFDDIGDTLGGLFGGSGNILGPLVSTALTGLALRQVSNSIAKEQEDKKAAAAAATPDKGGTVNIQPAQDNKIPVLYGEGHF